MNAIKLNSLLLVAGLCLLASLFATPTALAAATTNTAPQRFKASLGGFGGTFWEIELRQGGLVCSKQGLSQGTQTRTTPTAPQWQDFRHALDELKVWQWRTNYDDPHAMDGTVWSLDIEYPDRRLHAFGRNSFPDDTGRPSSKPEGTAAFRRYLTAVERGALT